MSAVHQLRRNDPAWTGICINIWHETSDADLAQALEQNPFVTSICVVLGDSQHTDWEALLRVISARGNLGTVILMSAGRREDRIAPPALVRAFLLSFQQNTAIRDVHLSSLRLPADVSRYVDTATSITSFRLLNCEMDPVDRDQGTRDLAAALQCNTNIRTLELGLLDGFYTIAILRSLQANTYLKTLAFSYAIFQEAESSAIQQLLESTTSITRFEVKSAETLSERMFRPLAQAIINSESVVELKWWECRFHDVGSTTLFQNILQNKRNLTYLCLENCNFLERGEIQETLFAALLRPDSPLRCFEFTSHNLDPPERLEALLQAVEKSKLERFAIWDYMSPRPQLNMLAQSIPFMRIKELQVKVAPSPNNRFDNLIRAVEKSKLESFKVGVIGSQQQLQTLTQSIPLMRIKELYIEFDTPVDEENAKQEILQAVKNNFSLRSVESRQDRRNLFNDDDKLRLLFYSDRNERLNQWGDNPDTVDTKVWPEALTLAEKAGPDSLFRSLRSVLGGDSMSLQSGRKRKRSQFYSP